MISKEFNLYIYSVFTWLNIAPIVATFNYHFENKGLNTVFENRVVVKFKVTASIFRIKV